MFKPNILATLKKVIAYIVLSISTYQNNIFLDVVLVLYTILTPVLSEV